MKSRLSDTCCSGPLARRGTFPSTSALSRGRGGPQCRLCPPSVGDLRCEPIPRNRRWSLPPQPASTGRSMQGWNSQGPLARRGFTPQEGGLAAGGPEATPPASAQVLESELESPPQVGQVGPCLWSHHQPVRAAKCCAHPLPLGLCAVRWPCPLGSWGEGCTGRMGWFQPSRGQGGRASFEPGASTLSCPSDGDTAAESGLGARSL